MYRQCVMGLSVMCWTQILCITLSASLVIIFPFAILNGFVFCNFFSRLVAEISVEKKVKSQKAKAKSSEGRKQLSSVRVIQRNLVYIVGLPLNLADEEVYSASLSLKLLVLK